MDSVRRLPGAALLLLPGGLTVYFSFNAGGFFVGAPAAVAVLLALILVLRTTTAEQPFEGLGWPVTIVAGALALYAAWVLLSGSWSDAPGRATLEYDRALLYLLTFAFFASMPRLDARLALAVKGLVLGISVVCLISLLTRVAPDVWPIAPNIENDRLSYPVTYWNSLGVLASVGIALCFHLAASEREPAWARVLGAGLIPALSATLVLTLSRGAILALAVALASYVVLGRPRALTSALLAVLPPTAFAVTTTYGAERLTSEDPTSAAAVAQGHDVALAVGVCMAAAALLRLVLVRLDPSLAAFRLPARIRRQALAAAIAVPVVAAGIMFFALDAPAYVGKQYERFVDGDAVLGDTRSRLTDVGNNGRLHHWEVALDAFHAAPLRGSGAGTYQLLWAKDRPINFSVVDAHSLYVEALGELGLVGLVLIALAVMVVLVTLAIRIRGPDRALHAAIFAVSLAWALHAGIDWDWELPVVSVWFFALAGAGMAAERSVRSAGPATLTRVLIGLALLLLAITPARAALSQHHLDSSVEAFKDGDCSGAIDAALTSSSTLPVRPEPWEVIGYCDARLGKGELGARAFDTAIARDPRNWELHYGLALARGSAGLDPRPAIRRAVRLNPRDSLAQSAAKRFRTSDPTRWEREARASRVLIP